MSKRVPFLVFRRLAESSRPPVRSHGWLLGLLLSCAACGGTSPEPGSDGGPPTSTGDGGKDSGSGLGDGGTPTPEAGPGMDSGSAEGGGTTPEGGGPDGGPWVQDPASLVNTLFGTTAGGNTFPGPDFPFGMIQWSPDTSPHRNDGSGYDVTDTQLIGFSLTHISGPGCPAYGDIPMLPMVGALPTGDPSTHMEALSHDTEVGTAGYYTVQSGTGSTLVTTELTSTLHSAMARFTFPATKNADLLIKLLDSEIADNTGSTATAVGTNEIQGSTTNGANFCTYTSPYTVYFDIVFDQPFTVQTINNAAGTAKSVVFLTFDTTTTQVVQAKVAISFVSVASAAANWAAENPNPTWDFDGIKTQAHTAWNGLLNQIQIAGSNSTRQGLFYTSLYHSLLHPNVYSDASGQYLGFDNQTHMVGASDAGTTQKDQYANYSGWDIYHSQVQLSALIAPQQMSDSAQSILNDAAQNPARKGQLVKWALGNAETYTMVGDPSDGILAGYYAFGATAFDTKTALAYMIAEASQVNNMRPGLADYVNLGYIADDGSPASYGCCNLYGSVSTTLEYAEADFALSQFAAAMGDTANATHFLTRSQNWQNVLDPTSNFFNPRLTNGTFVAGVELLTKQGMVEGNASQYRWIIPFARQAQLTAMGGPSVVNPLLGTFFSNLDDSTGPDAFFANEFELGAQYWQNYTGQPWSTQDVVNRLRTVVFRAAPSFFDNNDDLGAESSLLAWSMLGLYPDYPGSAIMTLNSPEFAQELLHLPGGSTLAINAPGVSAATPYIQSLKVNGADSTATWLPATFIQSGGTVDFTLGSGPNMSWGTGASDAPPSFGTESTAAIGFVQPDGPLVVVPGATATATIGAQSTRTDVGQTVSWQLAAGAGVPPDGGAPFVSATSGSFDLDGGARGTASLTLTAPLTEGTYTLPFQITSSLNQPCPGPTMQVVVAAPGSVSPYFNNAGISSDGVGAQNFDGDGYSYSSQALIAAGASAGATITTGGINYTWPSTTVGQMDNIEIGTATANQTITFSETAVKPSLGVLGAATDASSTGATADLTVTFSDGTTQVVTITLGDWTLGGPANYPVVASNTVAVTTPYRNEGGGKDTTKAYVFGFYTSLYAKPVTSITLPSTSTGGTIHLFAIVLQ